jgi:predicted RNA-binding Zn ribbon-like protein
MARCLLGPSEETVELAVELVNTWNRMATPPEGLPDRSALRRFLERHGLERASRTVGMEDAGHARELRDRLRGAFEAPDEATAVQVLNALLVEGGSVPELTRHDGLPWHFHFGPEDEETFENLRAVTSVALLDVIRTLGWQRLGRCAAAPCASVFVDRSRNRSRRYCSQLCADRMTQAAHRSRLRAARPSRRRTSRRPAPESG